jgi:MFS family permease
VLWLIPAVYFLFVTGEFLALTTIVLTLTEQGASGLRVGLLASALWLGILGSSLLAHRAVRRFGHARVFVGASALALLAMLALPLASLGAAAQAPPPESTWLVAVVVLGLGGGLVWVAGESWLAEVAPTARRGFYVGLFETSVGLALMAGPALLPAALALGAPPLWLAAALLGAGALCSGWLLAELPSSHGGRAPVEAAANATKDARLPRWVWPLVAVAAAGGALESGISAMLPSISMRLGFELQLAAWLGVVIGAGSAMLQPPFGALADRIGMRRTMALAWALLIATLLVLWGLADSPHAVLWAAGFVLGGVGGAVYTLVVIELGHRLTGGALVKAMGGLVTGYTLGTAGAPTAGGWLFDHAGLAGLAAALLVVALFGAGLAWRALRPVGGAARDPD